MMIRRGPLLPALLVGALCAGGCVTVNRTERAEPRARPDVVADQRIDTDPSLADRLAVTEVVEGRAGDLLRIQVTLQSTSNRTRSYSYQFEWIEADGIVVTSPDPIWRPLRISGGDVTSLVGTAPNPRVVDFRFKVRESSRFKLIEP